MAVRTVADSQPDNHSCRDHSGTRRLGALRRRDRGRSHSHACVVMRCRGPVVFSRWDALGCSGCGAPDHGCVVVARVSRFWAPRCCRPEPAQQVNLVPCLVGVMSQYCRRVGWEIALSCSVGSRLGCRLPSAFWTMRVLCLDPEWTNARFGANLWGVCGWGGRSWTISALLGAEIVQDLCGTVR